MVPLWLAMGVMIWLGLYFNVDRSVIAGSVIAVGLISDAFAWLLGIIALVPITSVRSLSRCCPSVRSGS